METHPSFTRWLDYHVIKFLQQPPPSLQSKSQQQQKINLSFPLYHPTPAPRRCPLRLLACFSSLAFSLVFPFPPPPSSFLVLPPPTPHRALACSGQAAWQLLHLKNINQCCCGDRIRLSSFIFHPSFPPPSSRSAALTEHDPLFVCFSKV